MTTQNISNRFNATAIKEAQAQFTRGLGNGKASMTAIAFLFEAAVATRDTTGIKAIMSHAASKVADKDDQTAKQVLGLFLRNVFPGAALSKDKNGNPVIKIKGIEADTDALDTIVDLAKRNISFRSVSTIREAFKGEKVEKPFDAKAWAERQAKAHPDMIGTMIAALEAQRAGIKADPASATGTMPHSEKPSTDFTTGDKPMSRGQKAAATRAANKAAKDANGMPL